MLAAKDHLGDARRWQSDDMIYSIERIDVGALKSPPHLPPTSCPHTAVPSPRPIEPEDISWGMFLGFYAQNIMVLLRAPRDTIKPP